MEQASKAIEKALITPGRKVYIYGCGSTGRLAKQIESETWKQFWRRLDGSALLEKIQGALGDKMGDKIIGELTGGDRALVNALEGFEDLLVIGDLQLQENQVKRGDVVIAVTEGGETSSVIGTILAAWRQYGLDELSGQERDERAAEARSNLYFIFNNPSDVLLPFERSRKVLENEEITKIPLWTGPQAIGGSTRMQASTSE
jgi:N-acetylmuramic acid 6-phosphate (MurNAc-6-P) etherase